MIGSCLPRIEVAVLEYLKEKLKDINYYIDNYEKEIIRERADNQKMIGKITKQIEIS